ncbi:hypothetical protein VTK26DRAFT_3067 [Humicola hyalothermophila]
MDRRTIVLNAKVISISSIPSASKVRYRGTQTVPVRDLVLRQQGIETSTRMFAGSCWRHYMARCGGNEDRGSVLCPRPCSLKLSLSFQQTLSVLGIPQTQLCQSWSCFSMSQPALCPQFSTHLPFDPPIWCVRILMPEIAETSGAFSTPQGSMSHLFFSRFLLFFAEGRKKKIKKTINFGCSQPGVWCKNASPDPPLRTESATVSRLRHNAQKK